MPKQLHNDVFDLGLQQVSNNANWGGSVLSLVLCVGEPLSVAEASTIYPGGKRISDAIVMAGGDFVLGDRSAGGREVTVSAKSGTIQGSVPIVDSGTASSGGVNTLTDITKAWGVDANAGKVLHIVGGTGSGQSERIVSNTATVNTIATNWVTQPDATSQYEIREDLHIALYDGGGTPRLLVVNDETSNQSLTSGNPVNIPSWKFGASDPV